MLNLALVLVIINPSSVPKKTNLHELDAGLTFLCPPTSALAPASGGWPSAVTDLKSFSHPRRHRVASAICANVNRLLKNVEAAVILT